MRQRQRQPRPHSASSWAERQAEITRDQVKGATRKAQRKRIVWPASVAVAVSVGCGRGSGGGIGNATLPQEVTGVR